MAYLALFRNHFFDNNGNSLAGGKVYVYSAGTTTPKNSYTDATGVTPNANPVILDSKGEANIWLTGINKINITDANDVQITGWPVDNIGTNSNANDTVYTPSGTGAVATTVQGKLGERFSVFDFLSASYVNAILTGNYIGITPAQMAAAVQVAITYGVTHGGFLIFPFGYYSVTTLLVSQSAYTFTIDCEGARFYGDATTATNGIFDIVNAVDFSMTGSYRFAINQPWYYKSALMLRAAAVGSNALKWMTVTNMTFMYCPIAVWIGDPAITLGCSEINFFGMKFRFCPIPVYLGGTQTGACFNGSDITAEAIPSSFMGYMAGTVLTVTSITSGAFQVGQIITGAGVSANTQIVSGGTGVGGLGTYNINNSQTVGSSGTPIAMVAAYRMNSVWMEGGFIKVIGGSMVSDGTSVDPQVYLNPSTDATAVYPTFVATGAHIETNTGQMCIIQNPKAIAAPNSTSSSVIFNSCLGYVGTQAAQDYISALDTSYSGTIDVTDCNFYSGPVRSAFNISTSSSVCKIKTDKISWKTNFKNWLGGISQGIVLHDMQPAVYAYGPNVTYTFGNDVPVKFLTSDTTSNEFPRYAGNYSTSTGLFTVPGGGFSRMDIYSYVNGAGATGGTTITIKRNGVIVRFGSTAGATSCVSITATLYNLTAGETIGIYVLPYTTNWVVDAGQYNVLNISVAT